MIVDLIFVLAVLHGLYYFVSQLIEIVLEIKELYYESVL